ncbi:hypothetical protein UM93_02620 [Psychromicrobium lacuslunae]|uniref:Uncharacterized protein n=1 Tax=Psychromicrobium lacuslunae TaxID=1618207 RepID=A0A0D4BX52_9MICC|nr:hypothetical protein UM93_02620 [Psychromicrobium lacuslunae]
MLVRSAALIFGFVAILIWQSQFQGNGWLQLVFMLAMPFSPLNRAVSSCSLGRAVQPAKLADNSAARSGKVSQRLSLSFMALPGLRRKRRALFPFDGLTQI